MKILAITLICIGIVPILISLVCGVFVCMLARDRRRSYVAGDDTANICDFGFNNQRKLWIIELMALLIGLLVVYAGMKILN